jgi:hypothetical protein
MEAMRNAHNILVRKPEGSCPFGRPRHRWEDNIKVDLKKVWIRFVLAWSREHGSKPSGSIKEGNVLTSWAPVSLLRRAHRLDKSLLVVSMQSYSWFGAECGDISILQWTVKRGIWSRARDICDYRNPTIYLDWIAARVSKSHVKRNMIHGSHSGHMPK